MCMCVWQIFGPGKKLGHLILFTMCLLIIASSISLQLFCNIRNFDKFGRFDQVGKNIMQDRISYFQKLELEIYDWNFVCYDFFVFWGHLDFSDDLLLSVLGRCHVSSNLNF